MFRFTASELDEMFIDMVDEESNDPRELLFWILGLENIIEWENPKGK